MIWIALTCHFSFCNYFNITLLQYFQWHLSQSYGCEWVSFLSWVLSFVSGAVYVTYKHVKIWWSFFTVLKVYSEVNTVCSVGISLQFMFTLYHRSKDLKEKLYIVKNVLEKVYLLWMWKCNEIFLWKKKWLFLLSFAFWELNVPKVLWFMGKCTRYGETFPYIYCPSFVLWWSLLKNVGE